VEAIRALGLVLLAWCTITDAPAFPDLDAAVKCEVRVVGMRPW
jgi:hypothetical protein